jgi:hypothetical protein
MSGSSILRSRRPGIMLGVHDVVAIPLAASTLRLVTMNFDRLPTTSGGYLRVSGGYL